MATLSRDPGKTLRNDSLRDSGTALRNNRALISNQWAVAGSGGGRVVVNALTDVYVYRPTNGSPMVSGVGERYVEGYGDPFLESLWI